MTVDSPPDGADRVQVGVTPDANEKLLELKEVTPYFREEADIYRIGVAAALALRTDITDGLRRADYRTKFRTFRTDLSEDELPRLDSADHRLAQMVELFYPEAIGQPYRFSQYLAVIGINYLYRELVERRRPLSGVIQALYELSREQRLDDPAATSVTDGPDDI